MSKDIAQDLSKEQQNQSPVAGTATLDDALDLLKRPKQTVEMPPHLQDHFDEEDMAEGEAALDDDAPFSTEDELEAGISDAVVAEYKDMSLMAIGMFDSLVGSVGMMITRRDPDRYMRFAKKDPPAYYVRAVAGVMHKYQARMSPEMLLIIALSVIYIPSGTAIYQDLKSNKKDAQEKKRQLAQKGSQAPAKETRPAGK